MYFFIFVLFYNNVIYTFRGYWFESIWMMTMMMNKWCGNIFVYLFNLCFYVSHRICNIIEFSLENSTIHEEKKKWNEFFLSLLNNKCLILWIKGKKMISSIYRMILEFVNFLEVEGKMWCVLWWKPAQDDIFLMQKMWIFDWWKDLTNPPISYSRHHSEKKVQLTNWQRFCLC